MASRRRPPTLSGAGWRRALGTELPWRLKTESNARYLPLHARPGKKPLSSMSPLIGLQEGALRIVVGASGGSRIISAVAQTILR